ncbi:glycosyltransferase N-terminal domain-containing protein [Allgaiera indica]|nr:glycosyltransferase N-terminal domain-containing protein [Allgaiera indica]SDX09867.1 3-deoxy-D-manno-octulosonic-acid transferase [Allgaiera indica]
MRPETGGPHRSALLALYLGFSRLAPPLFRRAQRRRLAQGKEDPARAAERWGHAAGPRPEGPLIWFHAASVGESLSLLGLVDALHGARPDLRVLVTTGTVTSAALMEDRLPAFASHAFAPYDTPGAIRRFLDHWRPDVAIWAESELWPRMVHDTHARGIPMLLINARLSEASAKGWARARGLARAMLGRFDAILAQDDQTARRLTALGAPAARVRVTGTLKEDAAAPDCDPAELARLQALLGARPRWLAASTHPGEEEVAAKAHRAFPDHLLILAPRHPERGAALAAELRAAGWTVAQRAAGEDPGPETRIYLADTLGEMGLWFRLAPISFVGGSLTEVGGHNPYEPAALHSAILHGPHVANFAPIYARLAAADGALEVRDAESLAQALAALSSAGAAQAQAERARDAATEAAGATRTALETILSALDRPGPAEVLVTNLHRRFTGVSATAAAVTARHARQGRAVAPVGQPLPGCPEPMPARAALALSRRPPPGRRFRIWHVRRDPEMALAILARDLLRLPIRTVFTSAAIRRHSALPRWMISRMDAVIATTERAASFVPNTTAIVPHGVDTARFAPASDRAAAWAALGHGGTRGIATVGRIRPEKGTDTFVAAMIRLLPEMPGTTALVIGAAKPRDQPFLDRLKTQVAAAGLSDRILFVGEIPADRMPKTMRALSLLIATPRYEGYGMTPLEAMAAAVPCVLTETGNFEAFIGNADAGRMVPFGDAEAAAEAARALLATGPAAGAAARTRAETLFSLDREADAIWKVYETLWSAPEHP